MTLYETMNKEEVVDFLCAENICSSCKAKEYCDDSDCKNCGQVKLKYLKKTQRDFKPRYSVIECDEDLDAIYKNFREFCSTRSCNGCYYGDITCTTADCFLEYLKEKTIVPQLSK